MATAPLAYPMMLSSSPVTVPSEMVLEMRVAIRPVVLSVVVEVVKVPVKEAPPPFAVKEAQSFAFLTTASRSTRASRAITSTAASPLGCLKPASTVPSAVRTSFDTAGGK